MTVRPTSKPDALKRAVLELTVAVNRLSQLPACHMSDEFTDDMPPGRALSLIDRCNACPVLTECRRVAALTPARDKQHVVMAGVRYGAHGRPVDLTAAVRQQERDQFLTAAAKLRDPAQPPVVELRDPTLLAAVEFEAAS